MDFTYLPLSNDCIRLFRGRIAANGTLSGELESFDFPNLPPFRALSYTWGLPQFTQKVIVDGKSLHILDSVHAFFKQFFTKTQSHWWWIDSICINQQDNSEKASQVILMRRIFQEAIQTCVWLGDESDDSECAFTFLKLVASHKTESRRGYTEESWIVDFRRLDGPYRKEWQAVNNLLRRPWWTRVWTVQEFVVPMQLQICCGTQSISRGQFRMALHRIYDCGVDLSTPAPCNRGRLLGKYKALRHDNDSSIELSLVATLSYIGDHQASDARDYVYSLSGIVNDFNLAGTPDYNQPVEVLYTKIVQAFIERYQSLDIICFATIFQDLDDPQASLPSWVPDWRISVFPLVVPLMVSQGGSTSTGTSDHICCCMLAQCTMQHAV